MVLPVDQSKVVGSTVHDKAIYVMDEAECNILYGSQKKVKRVEGVVVNVDQQINKQRRNQFYVIADYKNPDGSVKMARLHIKSVVAGPVIVTVPVNIPATTPLFTVTTTTIVPANTSTSVPADHSTPVDSTPVDPAPVPTTTLLLSPLHFFQQPPLSLSIALILLRLHPTPKLPLPTLSILLLMLSPNLIQPPPHAYMPIFGLKRPLYLIQLHLLKISL